MTELRLISGSGPAVRYKVFSNLHMPVRKTPEAAGFDLVARTSQVIAPGQVGGVPVGLWLELPINFEAQVRPRSGMNMRGHLALFGTIDADYRGEIKVCLFNAAPEPLHVKQGDRVAQLVISALTTMPWVETEGLTETERGEQGFGSTGLNDLNSGTDA